MGNTTKKKTYLGEHILFTFQPVDSLDYEVWEDSKISESLGKYIEWFKNHGVPAKKYNFKKYTHAQLPDDFSGHVTVQIFDKKIDTLFKLTWL